jgi:hypothetical protein
MEEESERTNGAVIRNYHLCGSQDSVVGIVTCCGLDDLRFKLQGSKIFCNHPDWCWSLLYDGYWISFQGKGVKWSGRSVNHPPPSNAKVKERIELNRYSPSGLSWPVIG